MSANVETMFSVREKPWHGLGKVISDAPNSEEAIRLAGLDWNVYQQNLITENGLTVSGYKANIRDSDNSVLGIVSDRYKIVQNQEAFQFTDELLGQGVRYETAGSLQGGKKTWILAKLPNEYIIAGDQISPYLVFFNSHDGSGAVRCAITPIRVVCQNTLNLALSTAKRSWSAVHTQKVTDKMQEAKQTLFFAEKYMSELGREIYCLEKISMSDKKVLEYIQEFFPEDVTATTTQRKNMKLLREDMKMRYFDAPDLKQVGKNAYRFVNAVSDFATHAKPLRETATYKENLFLKTVEGNALIDKAYQMAKVVA